MAEKPLNSLYHRFCSLINQFEFVLYQHLKKRNQTTFKSIILFRNENYFN
jgi:hypothetical protein